MKQIAKALRDGHSTIKTMREAHKARSTIYTMQPIGLLLAYHMARRSPDTIVETGSGLSTVILGLAAEAAGQSVICIEHDAEQAKRTQEMLDDAGVYTVGLNVCPVLKGGTYDPPGLPKHIGFWLHDGPLDFTARTAAFKMMTSDRRVGSILIDDFDFYPDSTISEIKGAYRVKRVPDINGIAVCVPRVSDQKDKRK